MSKARDAADDIKKSSGNDNVIVRKLDLASMASIREFAKTTIEKEERLDVLINNAGTFLYYLKCDSLR